ncbi:MAG: hypothetical protein AAGA77_05085 [Bacteroidota bacterium]
MKKLLFIVFILLTGCSEDPMEPPVQFLKQGCKPLQVHDDGSLSGSSIEDFTYGNDQLTTMGRYTYEYDNGYVSRIYLGTTKYATFTYDTKDRVIASRKYSSENENEEFQLVSHYEYDYQDDFIVKSNNVLSSEETVYFRNPQTTNIDSLIAYDADSVIKKIEHFQYDENPNVYSNVNTPMYNFDQWIVRRNRNNISFYERKDPTSNLPLIRYSVDINYNEFGYPESMYFIFQPGEELIRTFIYTDCQE